KGPVIHAPVIAGGEIAGIPGFQLQESALDGAADHADGGGLADELREQAEHVDAHQKSASQSTVTRPASNSTETMKSSIRKGISRSRSPDTTITSLAPVLNRCETVPSSTPSRLRTRRPSRSTQ